MPQSACRSNGIWWPGATPVSGILPRPSLTPAACLRGWSSSTTPTTSWGRAHARRQLLIPDALPGHLLSGQQLPALRGLHRKLHDRGDRELAFGGVETATSLTATGPASRCC